MRILIVYTNRVARLEGLAADLQRALCFEDRLRETRAGRCSPSIIISGTIHPLTRRTFSDLRSLPPPPLFATRGYQRLHLPMLSPRLPPLSRVKRAIKPGKLRGLDVEKIRRFQRWRDACCDARTSAASKFAPLLSLSLSLGY